MSRIDKAVEKALKARNEAEATPGDATAQKPDEPSWVAESVSSERQEPVNGSEVRQERSIRVSSPIVLNKGAGNEGAREEYGKLKSLLLQSADKDPSMKSILVTSAHKDEGKSITALNLSLSLASSYDNTVLLVDADLRKPSLHSLIGLNEGPGLVQILKGEATFQEALVHTDLGRLAVLPAGGIPEDPLELLSSVNTRKILEEIKSRYPERMVIFDSPPILPFADASVLGNLLGAVLFVVREGRVNIGQVSEGIKRLGDARVVGTVLNDASKFANRHASYKYDYY